MSALDEFGPIRVWTLCEITPRIHGDAAEAKVPMAWTMLVISCESKCLSGTNAPLIFRKGNCMALPSSLR